MVFCFFFCLFFFFKQKTAYEMRISDWSSDVCASDLAIPPGAIVGIIGPNGAGKSTLFKLITGAEKPDSGEVIVGPSVKLAYVDQSREALEGNKNVWQEVSGGSDILTINGVEIQSRAYIGRFNFKGQDQQKMEIGRAHV